MSAAAVRRRAPRRRWSAEEDRVLLDGRRATPPVMFKILAARLGRSVGTCQVRHCRLTEGAVATRLFSASVTVRTCLKCGQPFASAEPKSGNRVCPPCKASVEHNPAAEEFPVRVGAGE